MQNWAYVLQKRENKSYERNDHFKLIRSKIKIFDWAWKILKRRFYWSFLNYERKTCHNQNVRSPLTWILTISCWRYKRNRWQHGHHNLNCKIKDWRITRIQSYVRTQRMQIGYYFPRNYRNASKSYFWSCCRSSRRSYPWNHDSFSRFPIRTYQLKKISWKITLSHWKKIW